MFGGLFTPLARDTRWHQHSVSLQGIGHSSLALPVGHFTFICTYSEPGYTYHEYITDILLILYILTLRKRNHSLFSFCTMQVAFRTSMVAVRKVWGYFNEPSTCCINLLFSDMGVYVIPRPSVSSPSLIRAIGSGKHSNIQKANLR